MDLTQEQLEAAFAKGLEGFEAKLAPTISEQVEAKLKEMGLDKLDLKAPALLGDEDARAKKSKKERGEKIGKFIRAVKLGDRKTLDEMEIKTMETTTDSAGGFLVPEELYNEIVRIAEDFGYARKFGRPFTLSGPAAINAEASSVSVSWPGEGNAGSASQPVLKQLRLEPKTLMGITTQSNELLADANMSVVDYLTLLFAEAFAGEEDNQAFNGVGTPFTGILQHNDVSEVVMASGLTDFTDITINHLINMRAQVKSSVLPTCGYWMHRTVWDLILQITENSRHVLTYSNPQVVMTGPTQLRALAPAGAIDQYPVYLSDKMPAASATAVSTPFVIFGSMERGLFFGDRQQVAMAISEHATVGTENLFEENKSAVRMTERVAIGVGLPAAFVRLVTAAS